MSILIKPIEVHLQLYSILREKLPAEARGRITLQLEVGATLADILESLDIKRMVVIGVNDTYERDLSSSVHEGDEIKIFSAVSGG